jgi:hypothetical protein
MKKNFELYNDEHNENLDDVGSDDSDDDRESELWIEKKITDVGNSPSEEARFPNHSSASDDSSDDEGFGEFVKSNDTTPTEHATAESS